MPRLTRRAVAGAIALLLALSLVELSALSSHAAAPRGRTVTAIAGEPVSVTGVAPKRVRRPVVLQQRVGSHWKAVTRKRTTATGAYRFDIAARAATYRVQAPRLRTGQHRLAAWASAPTTVLLAKQSATLSGPAVIDDGAAVTLTATYAPVRPGRTVRLERLVRGSWRSIATSRQDARGRASFSVRTPAASAYRTVAASWRGAAVVTSRATSVASRPPHQQGPWVTGYYAGWFWDQMYAPTEVDMTAMTHFVFGRVAPGNGSIGGKPGQIVKAAGTAHDRGTAPGGGSVEDYLVHQAHAAGTKAILMLGGDGFDGKGFTTSTTDAVRPTFVDNLVDYLVMHDYDGVDIDWENCLNDELGCGEVDAKHPIPGVEKQRRLLALIADVRAESVTRQRYVDDALIITFPGYPIKTNSDDYPQVPRWQAQVARAVDQYNLMSYGIGTTWNQAGWDSWFSGALHGAEGNHPVDIEHSVQAYVNSGVPRDRIGLGIGFYGIYFGPSITGPRQDTTHNDIYETNDVALRYSSLDEMGYLSHGTRHFDDEAKSTYITYDAGGYVPPREGELPPRSPAGFLSFEDEQSIAAKAEWAKQTGLGGAMIWTLNYGWLRGSQTNPLLDQVKQSFLGR